MLKSKWTFFVNFLSFSILVAFLITSIQEAEFYVQQPELWQANSWNFWK